MKRVTGIGGIFFKCKDVAATKRWYEQHLGIPDGKYGHQFVWEQPAEGNAPGSTTWNPMSEKTEYFGSPQEFMVNYRVADLVALVAALRAEGVKILGEMQEFDFGKFIWVEDCDGRRVELWEPVD